MTDPSFPSSEMFSREPQLGPGALLRQKRERLGLSLIQVASFLRLSTPVIEKMERDHYEGASLLAYERGYIRAYARYLGFLEPEIEDLVNQFNRLDLQEQEVVLGPAFSWKKQPLRERHVRWVSYLALLGFVVLMIMWWQTQSMPKLKLPTDAGLATLAEHLPVPVDPSPAPAESQQNLAAAAPPSSPEAAPAAPVEQPVAQASQPGAA